MIKEYRYYSDNELQSLYEACKTVPEKYTKNYKGTVVSVEFHTLKKLLNLKPTKTIKGCSDELWKLSEDLGYKLGTGIEYSIHNNWVWFNLLGEFEGYYDDLQKVLELRRQALVEEDKRLLRAEILSGTWGINNIKEEGGVYLISCGDYFKIGHSTKIKTRLSSIKTSNPYEVELVTKYTPYKINNKLLETYLHEEFKQHHHRNEWFSKGFTEDEFITACVKFYTEAVSKIYQGGLNYETT